MSNVKRPNELHIYITWYQDWGQGCIMPDWGISSHDADLTLLWPTIEELMHIPHADGLVQHCSNSSAFAMEIPLGIMVLSHQYSGKKTSLCRLWCRLYLPYNDLGVCLLETSKVFKIYYIYVMADYSVFTILSQVLLKLLKSLRATQYWYTVTDDNSITR